MTATAGLAEPLKRLASATHWYHRRLARHSLPGIAVLCYHAVRENAAAPGAMPFQNLHVRTGTLEAHCRFLRTACDPISLDEWRAARDGRAPWPPRPVLVTFDDGYRSVFTEARPVLERWNIPAVVFVCTRPVARRESLWYDTMARQSGDAAVERAKATAADKWPSLLETFARPIADDDPCATMTADEIRQLAASRLFEVGSHTCSHPILAALAPDQQRLEIRTSVEALGSWTERPVRALAYPNGRPGLDYTAETRHIAREAGIEFAFSTESRFADRTGDPLDVPRFMMLDDISEAELAHRLSYSWRVL